MADPRPTLLKFFLEVNDDAELSCFFCTLPKCDLLFEVRGSGQMRWVGVHSTCAEAHAARQTKTKDP